MAKIKLTKSAVDTAQVQAEPVELRDTLVPGFLCKITPAGRKVFTLQYRTNSGERRKPALGLYGELTAEQACSLAQEWLAESSRCWAAVKVQGVKRQDIAGAMKKMAHKPAAANRTFSVLRKMFNLAEVWGYRPDGTNPCRHVSMYPNSKATHLISDEDMGKLFRYLDYLETDGLGLDHAILPLAIRLQFEFAGRRSEIISLQWD